MEELTAEKVAEVLWALYAPRRPVGGERATVLRIVRHPFSTITLCSVQTRKCFSTNKLTDLRSMLRRPRVVGQLQSEVV